MLWLFVYGLWEWRAESLNQTLWFMTFFSRCQWASLFIIIIIIIGVLNFFKFPEILLLTFPSFKDDEDFFVSPLLLPPFEVETFEYFWHTGQSFLLARLKIWTFSKFFDLKYYLHNSPPISSTDASLVHSMTAWEGNNIFTVLTGADRTIPIANRTLHIHIHIFDILIEIGFCNIVFHSTRYHSLNVRVRLNLKIFLCGPHVSRRWIFLLSHRVFPQNLKYKINQRIKALIAFYIRLQCIEQTTEATQKWK